MLRELTMHFAERNMWDFGVPIRMFRSVHKVTQEGLEQTIGVMRGTVNNWESRKKYPTLKDCELLARAFRIELPLFLYLAFRGSLDTETMQDAKALSLQLLYAVAKPLPLINPRTAETDDIDLEERRA